MWNYTNFPFFKIKPLIFWPWIWILFFQNFLEGRHCKPSTGAKSSSKLTGIHHKLLQWSCVALCIGVSCRSATCKSSHLQMFFKIGVLNKFAIFTRKHLCRSFFIEHLRRLLLNLIKGKTFFMKTSFHIRH